MDYYALLKFLHVFLIIIWLGGGASLVILAMRAERARADTELCHIVQQVIFMAKVFVAVAIAAVLMGIGMVLLHWSFAELWITIGLTGFLLTFAMGLLVLKPRADHIGVLMAEGGITPAVVAQSHRLLQIAKFDLVMLFIVAADMVVKPTSASYATLTLMAVAFVGAAVAFLPKRSGYAPSQP
jgi:uncharacterized membrane protein